MERSGLDRSCQWPITSLIFPTYNPGLTLRRTWQELQAFLGKTEGWEVIFVCDGCTDGSPDLLASWLPQATGKVRLVSYSSNRGKGYAVRQGLAVACGRQLIFTDVDLAYGLDDVMRVHSSLQNGADVAIASRTHPQSMVTLPAHLQGYVYRRHLQSQVFSRLVQWLLPLRQGDTQAGLKGLTAESARSILPYLTCNGFGFDCELLTAAHHLGLNVQELPVRVQYEDRSSTTDLATISAMLRDLWRIRKRWQREWNAEGALPALVGRRQAA
jgi:cellulose synthase/poly-beta-1,6-N-acetylglucosamine synthase-like glycosyltransferase